MRTLILTSLLCIVMHYAFGQALTIPPSGDNQKASVTQYIGPVSVTINYSSPDVHGPNGEDRTGHIWGEVAHYGFIDQGYGSSKAAPWRAGANENTTISFSHDVTINGKQLKAGTYALALALAKDAPWTWIFSRSSQSWGTYFYDESEDALRTEATPKEAPYTEWLTYGFDNRLPSSTVAYLQWENKRIDFKIDVPNVNALYVDIMRNELKNYEGFDYRNLQTAAMFCVQNKINLEEALSWANRACTAPTGLEDFNTLRTKAAVLKALNRNAEADDIMTKAINHTSATIGGIHQYGRTLLSEGNVNKAMEVFKLNSKRNPNDKFTTRIGLARGYAALGDKKNAIKNWEIALKNIPDDQKENATMYENELKKLKG